MKKIIVIPARYASSRYPGKPLVSLTGYNGIGKSLIQRTWEAATQVKDIDEIVVATDDSRIAEEVDSFGGKSIFTSKKCKNGTERCAEVSQLLPEYELIINLQGDAPLTPHYFIENLIASLTDEIQYEVSTPVLKCDMKSLYDFIEDRRNGRVGGTTAIFSKTYKALYFSKEVVPYTGKKFDNDNDVPLYHHVGVYAYKKSALDKYILLNEGNLEKFEGLEQLRFLENDIPVKCVEVQDNGRHFWELNNPEDVKRIESVLQAHKIE